MFHVIIETENDAFGLGGKKEEIVRILHNIVNGIESGRQRGKCYDFNGNTCGTWELNDDR